MQHKDLSTKQIRFLRGLAHPLTPAVQTGKSGVTAAFVKEVDRNLKDHELIKVRINTDERTDFLATAEELAKSTAAMLVQTIGRIVVLYREGDEPEIRLPNAKGELAEPKAPKAPKAPTASKAPKVVRPAAKGRGGVRPGAKAPRNDALARVRSIAARGRPGPGSKSSPRRGGRDKA
jgi:RNA-binding protein